MKTANTTLTKEKRKTIANAQKMVDLMHSVKSKIDRAKENPVKADLVKVAERVGKEMAERREKSLKEEK